MKRIPLFLMVAICAGCQPSQSVVEPKASAKADQKEEVIHQPETGVKPAPIAAEKPTPTEKAIREKLEKEAKAVKEPTVVQVGKPGTESWQKASLDPIEFGGRLDSSALGWSDIAGSFQMTLQNAHLKGQQIGKFLIDSKSLYKIDFVDVLAPTGPNMIWADGTTKTILHGKDSVQRIPLTQKAPPPNAKDFYALFTLRVFEPFTEQRPTWKPILSDLKRSGYQLTLESKNMESGGVMRPFYRLIIAKPGIGLNAFEARFDGIRLVPLTMKMNATDPNGAPIVAEYRSIWNFNQKVKDQLVQKSP